MEEHLFDMESFDALCINENAFDNLEHRIDSFDKIKDVKTNMLFGKTESIEVPMLSVIIPTCGRSSLFKEALYSVLNQAKPAFSWEVLVMDNTPLDDMGKTPALKIVQDFSDDRVYLYHNAINIGSGYNWNRGVELSRGEWITFLHDDDVLCHDSLIRIGKIIDNMSKRVHKSLGYIQARRYKFINAFNESEINFKILPFCLELTQLTSLLLGHTHTGMPTCGTTIKKSAYIKAGGINYDFGPTADAVLGYQIMKDYTVIRSGCVLGGYRWADNESQKIDTIDKLLISDELFARYRINKSCLGKVWGRLFMTAYIVRNKKAKYGGINKKISISIFEKLRIYSYEMFLIIVKIFMCIKGLIRYFIL